MVCYFCTNHQMLPRLVTKLKSKQKSNEVHRVMLIYTKTVRQTTVLDDMQCSQDKLLLSCQPGKAEDTELVERAQAAVMKTYQASQALSTSEQVLRASPAHPLTTDPPRSLWHHLAHPAADDLELWT